MTPAPAPHVTVLTRVIHPLHPPGGMERAVFEQVRHLRDLGVGLTVVTQPPTSLTESIERRNSERNSTWTPPPDLTATAWDFVRYGDLPIRRNSVADRFINYPLFVRRVGARLRREPGLVGDLIHAHGLLAAAAPPGRPLILNPHGLEEFSRADWRKWLAYAPMRRALHRAARRADAVLATDHSMAPTVAAALGVPPTRVQVIPNGVSVAALDALADEERRANLRARLRLGDSSLRLVTVARLEHNKGLHLAVAALAGLGEALPADWGWWIVGRGREEAALRHQIADAGLAQRITVLGALDDADLHNLLPQMDLYLMPSLYEGSSLATLEAMCHGLPVLATTVGGIPDKVLPDRTGYMVLPGDMSALAGGLRAALADRPRWPALGAAGRTLVTEHFNWSVIARRLLTLYAELLSSRRP